MFSRSFLELIIWNIISNNSADLSYAIVPYGVNGKNIKRVLEEKYHICKDKVQIVDNYKCSDSDNIISINDFLSSYDNSIVFITCEDKVLNDKIYKILNNSIDKEKLVNLVTINNSIFSRVPKYISNVITANRLSLKNILPNYDCALVFHKPKKIRILFGDLMRWNIYESLAEEIGNSKDYDLLIVDIFSNKNLKAEQYMKKKNYKYKYYKDYKIDEDNPDILITCFQFMRMYENIENFDELRKYSKIVIVISYGLIKYSISVENYWKSCGAYLRLNPNYMIYDKLLYEELKKSDTYDERIIEIGNPKIDSIWSARTSKKNFYGKFSKINGKKIIVWALDHGVSGNTIRPNFTFDDYALEVFNLASKYKNIGIIIRAHSVMLDELIYENKVWSEYEYNCIKDYCDSTDNVIWDETEDYFTAINLADAFMIDCKCGMICSILPTLLPTAVVYRKDYWCENENDDLLSGYYKIDNSDSLEAYFKMISEGVDDKYNQRKELKKKYISNFDGCNGKRIKKFIDEICLEY